MSINLNVSNSAKVPERTKKVLPNKNKNEINEFSFTFTNSSKVPKPLLAKKRNPQLLTKKLNIITSKNTNPAPFTNGNHPAVTSSQTVVNDSEDNFSLSLNVVDGNESDRIKTASKLKQQKFTKKERKAFILEKRTKAYNKIEQDEAEKVLDTTTKIENKPKKSNANKALNVSNQTKPKVRKDKSLFTNNPEVPIIGQRLVHPVKETVFTGASMNTIGLHDHAVKNMADILKITELTTVQQRTVPVVLAGRDVLVRSQTGSGKTLAYALPIVQMLQDIRPKLTRNCGILALVIVPTRELAIQSYELFVKLLKPFTWIVSGYLTGGENRKAEKARLRKGINILVGTPGRLCDHLLHTESFKLDHVKYLVLDEADRLFELGYEKDVKKIVDVLNTKKPDVESKDGKKINPFDKSIEKDMSETSPIQSLLLSATLTAAVRQLAGLALKNPQYIDTSNVSDVDIIKETNTLKTAFDDTDEKFVIPETVSQSYVLIPPKLRLVTLTGLIACESQKPSKILVFLGTEQLVDFHYDLLIETVTRKVLDSDDEEEIDDEYVDRGNNDANENAVLRDVRFFKLHGSLTQQERSAIYRAFIKAKSGVLLTTDVIARGIDVPMVDLVVQFSPPQNIQDYVHRVGRTARAGRSGRAILFLAPNETEFVRMLESKRIRIAQNESSKFLQGIVGADNVSKTLEESASELQRKFEAVIENDKEMHEKACKAFVSWLRFSAAFPKELRQIFNVKTSHMGHYAKSLGLREPPKAFAKAHSAPKPSLPTNRLTYTERSEKRTFDPKTKKNSLKRPNSNNFNKFISKSISLSTSEFGSGLPPSKKKKSK